MPKPSINILWKFFKTVSTVVGIFFVLSACESEYESVREVIDLSGEWQLQIIDSTKTVEQQISNDFTDIINLPGTLDENRKGNINQEKTDYHLNRIYYHVGPVLFRREIIISPDWSEKHIELIMERTKVTSLWIDEKFIGTDNTISSHQSYDVSKSLTPGKHNITICVDNTESLVPVAGSHAYSEDTQTNWNGIIGKFCLEASSLTRIENVRVYPDVNKKNVRTVIKIKKEEKTNSSMEILLEAKSWNSEIIHEVPPLIYHLEKVNSDTTVEIIFSIGEDMQKWSEFSPALYKLQVTLSEEGDKIDNSIIDFGMREFKKNGTQFSINGTTTFLRGKHDACVFPLTGYPPMNVDGWLKVFNIAKTYGINHYRFHSWCPPAAAFQAADIAGIYLQPELPIWYSFRVNDSSQVKFMMNEGMNIMDEYGNHASFVMFSLGNEIWEDRTVLQKMVADFREYDNRHLYATGSNNRGGNPSYCEGDDFWVTFRTAPEIPDCSKDVRGSISYLDSKEGGIINTIYPSSDKNYSKAIEGVSVPVIGHEIGQYQIYPNYAEIKKYTGILKAANLEMFRDALKAKGMIEQAEAFHYASGALSMICYREDIEMAIRTPGFGGFQMLDLQDFPGQGTALVGILDSFMESKGLITPENFRRFCNNIVVLMESEKYCWSFDEPFSAKIKVANYSQETLRDKRVPWEVISESGNNIIEKGTFLVDEIPTGGLKFIGEIRLFFNTIHKAEKVIIKIGIEGTDYRNEYPVWIYPENKNTDVPKSIYITDQINSRIISLLKEGKKILLFPNSSMLKSNSVGGQFISEFWNYRMFTTLAKQFDRPTPIGTMGLLIDSQHPLFKIFPTEFHSNWQWWSVTKKSRPVILDGTEPDFKPIVQVIDNINRNHKLGLIFEMKVEKGKVLVCSSDLNSTLDKPEVRQLYKSIIQYMDSDEFDPGFEFTIEEFNQLFRSLDE